MDWIAALREQGDIAAKFTREVPIVLSDAGLTLDQASSLYRSVESGAQAFDRFVENMQHYDLDDALFEAADALGDIWSELSVAAANKVRTLRGLDPIEVFPPEDNDE